MGLGLGSWVDGGQLRACWLRDRHCRALHGNTAGTVTGEARTLPAGMGQAVKADAICEKGGSCSFSPESAPHEEQKPWLWTQPAWVIVTVQSLRANLNRLPTVTAPLCPPLEK